MCVKRCLGALLAFLVCLSTNRLFAWSEGGHHLIASMAFKQLEPARQQEILRILKAHPRFAEDFKAPANVRDENEWLIGRAGYWPDVVRSSSGKAYHRSTWHYELGATNVIGNVPAVPQFPGALPATATLETQELYLSQGRCIWCHPFTA